MRKQNFFMLALASLAFAACSNEELVSGGGTDTEIDSNGDAWVALDVRTPSTTRSRALNTPDQENSIAGEYEIKNVKAIFFDGPNKTSLVTKVIDLASGEIGTPGGDPGPNPPATPGPTDAFKVPTTSKTVLLVCNPGSIDFTSMNITPGSTTFADVNVAVEGSLSAITKSGEFLMTNAKGDLEPSDGYGNTISLKLHPTKEAAKGSPLTIHVDRVVAKVRVFTDKTSTVATVYDAGWVLNVTNKWFYPVSKRVKTWNEDPANTASGGRGTCITPFDQYRFGSYREDPNYNSTNIGTWNASNTAVYDNNYNYYPTTAKPAPAEWNTLNALVPAVGATIHAEYCMENTQEATYNMHAYTTQVLLKANFAPKGIKTKALDGTEGTTDVGENEDWMIILSGYYTYETLLDWIEYELKNKYTDNEPDKYNTPITNEFNKFLAAIGVGAVTLTSEADFKGGTNTAEQEASKLKGLFAAKENAVHDKGGQDIAGVTYYAAGVSYYKIMIKHDDTDKALNAFGEFGVVRNSVYDVRITKFNNPGYPVIPKPEPGIPDETDEEWLSIQIDVNPWTWYVQDVEL